MSHASDGLRWIFAAYLTLLVWPPIPLGSNRPWSWALMEVWILLLALAWLRFRSHGRFEQDEALAWLPPLWIGSRRAVARRSLPLASWTAPVLLVTLTLPGSLLTRPLVSVER